MFAIGSESRERTEKKIMQLKTDIKINGEWKWLCDSDSSYGAGGAYPSLAGHIESEAVANLATHLEQEGDCSETIEKLNISGVCARGRTLEAAGKQLDNGKYIVRCVAGDKKYQLLVTLCW